MKFDRRLTPARPDLAAAHLSGIVEAPRYAEGRRTVVIESSAPMRREPASDAPLETEALYGEAVMVYDESEGWAWAQLERDGYVGYLPAIALGAAPAPTHRVAALRTHAYPGPSIKLPPTMALPLGSRLSVVRREGDFAVTSGGFWLWARHLAEVDASAEDFVAVAEKFLHAPYLWGGRTSEGIDCSGLIQTALAAVGVAAPRDSDQQEASLGAPVPPDDPLARGDLVFWEGHVGVMRDAKMLLHANGWHMAVASEPLEEARARIANSGGGLVTRVKRMAAP